MLFCRDVIFLIVSFLLISYIEIWCIARCLGLQAGKCSALYVLAIGILARQEQDPMLYVVQLWQDFQPVSLLIERLMDVLKTPAEPWAVFGSRITLPSITGRVTFEGVHYRSGTRKSTIAKLMQR